MSLAQSDASPALHFEEVVSVNSELGMHHGMHFFQCPAFSVENFLFIFQQSNKAPSEK